MLPWLDTASIPLRASFSTSGLRLVATGDPAEPPGAAVELADGQFALQLDVSSLEQVLLQLANQWTKEHQATVEDVQLRLRGLPGRSLGIVATVKARKGFFSTSLELTGQLVIDDQMHAHVTDLELRGHGVLGKMVASLLRPRLAALEDQPIQLTSLAPGNLALTDVRFHVAEQLGLTVTLGPSRVDVLPPTTAKPAEPGAKRPRGGGTGAAPRGGAVPGGAAANLPPWLARQLDVYVIDTGWNESARRLLEEEWKVFDVWLKDHRVFRLTSEQSQRVLAKSPQWIGSDPILVVVDSDARVEQPHRGYGLRFCLGALAADERRGEELRRVLQLLVGMGTTSRRGRSAGATAPLSADDPRLHVLCELVAPSR